MLTRSRSSMGGGTAPSTPAKPTTENKRKSMSATNTPIRGRRLTFDTEDTPTRKQQPSRHAKDMAEQRIALYNKIENKEKETQNSKKSASNEQANIKYLESDEDNEENKLVKYSNVNILDIVIPIEPMPMPSVLKKLRKSDQKSRRKSAIGPIMSNESDDEDDRFEVISASPTPERVIVGGASRKSIMRRTRHALDLAKMCLHTSEVPEKLLKREEECRLIEEFIVRNVRNRCSEALYISGVPGTGKTASVMNVVSKLKHKEKALKFDFVSVNALELSNPRRLFCVIYNELVNGGETKRISPTTAQQRLNDMFSRIDKKRKPVVLLIDELDMLCTKRQEVVYTVLNWSAIEGSAVSVIAISNTLDLPERTLSQRVASRLGTRRLCFQPYSHDELTEIIKQRLSRCSAVDSTAVLFASRKVASLSGDLRKALELLRQAIDIAISDCETLGLDPNSTKLNFDHVNRAILESTSSTRMRFFETMSLHEEVMMRAMISDLEKLNLEETVFCRLLAEYKQLCFSRGLSPLSADCAFNLLMEMANSNFISISDPYGCGQMTRKLALTFPLCEAQFCLRQLTLDAERDANAVRKQ